MKKNKLFFTVLSMLIFLGAITSCSDTDFLKSEQEIRAYDQDKEILSHFIEIDTLNLSFHLNLQPNSIFFDSIPEYIVNEIGNVSEINKSKYEMELEDLNKSVRLRAGQTDFIELNTKYEKYLKKTGNSDINISLYEEEKQENNHMLRNGSLGVLLGIFTFDTNHGPYPIKGVVYGKDKVVTKTILEYSEEGFVEAEISCGMGVTDNYRAAVSIIRAASNTNSSSEHLHYWTSTRETGNNVEWNFYGKFHNRSFFSFGTVKIYEDGLPYPDPSKPEPYFAINFATGRPFVIKTVLVNELGQELLLGHEVFSNQIFLEHKELYWSFIKKQAERLSRISNHFEIKSNLSNYAGPSIFPEDLNEILNHTDNYNYRIQGNYLLLDDILVKVPVFNGYTILSNDQNRAAVFIDNSRIGKDNSLRNYLNSIPEQQMTESTLRTKYSMLFKLK